MPVIGLLDTTSPENNIDRLRAFGQGLKETGYVEGENVAISYRFAEIKLIACANWLILGPTTGCGDRHICKWCLRGQGGDHDDTDRVRHRGRSGPALVLSLALPDPVAISRESIF